MGQYYEKNKYYRAARIYYKTVVDEYPRTEKAELAKERLAAIQDEPDVPPEPLQMAHRFVPGIEETVRR